MSATMTISSESPAGITELATLPYQPEPPITEPSTVLEFGSGEIIAGVSEDESQILQKHRAVLVVVTVAGVNFLNTMGSGILTVALPTIAKSVGLSTELFLWPASIYALTCGCTLLLAGSIADILGRRIVFLTGTALFAVFTLGCALSKTGFALITFRALQGISISLCLTTAVGIISISFPSDQGNRRNVAFAATGAASPVGYTVGLVLGGVFVETTGWRAAYYFAVGINAVLLASALWGLPHDEERERERFWERLRTEIDWVGAVISTVSISLLSYVMAVVTGSAASIREVQNIILLSIALVLMVLFPFWMQRQERLKRPAIVPNSVWKQSAFTTTCIVVFLTWAAFNSFGYFATLFFQEIQHLSPLQTSLRLLPTVVCGILTNVGTGFLVRRTSASYLVAVSSVFSAAASLLMAIINPTWSFWMVGFPAVFLSPMSIDVLYTISNLIITANFPSSKQSLAGGVFNTVSQIGNSIGLTIGAVIAASVTASSPMLESTDSLEKGFRATFWACFAAFAFVAIVSLVGLKKAGKVGIKIE